jgi:hypothetical protein
MDSSLMLAEDPVVDGISYQGSGRWVLEDHPGIGASFDAAYLEAMEKETIE